MRAIAIAFLLFSIPAWGDTAVKETSCTDAANQDSWYDVCLEIYGSEGTLYCTPPDITQCWDFESGLAPWTTTGTAFANQPTYGDNVAAWRVLQVKPSPIHAGETMLDEMSAIGGDYWETAYSIGNQGQAWLGTYENRPAPSSPWGVTQGDAPQGTAISPSFTVDRDYVTFLVGGGCDVSTERVELQVLMPGGRQCHATRTGELCVQVPPYWATATGSKGLAMEATGTCDEELARRSFDTSGLIGSTVRVVVTDASSGAWGHINVDHVLHANTVPDDANGKNVPLWGFADTHAHFDNEHANLSLGGTDIDGYVLHGSVGTVTTDHNALLAQLGSCDGHGHHTNTGAYLLLEGLENSSLGSSPGLPLGCNEGIFDQHFQGDCARWGHNASFATPTEHDHWGQGVVPIGNDLVGWPYWYTRTHQQMHMTWVQRAYLGGQRLMVASAGNTEVFGMAMRGSHEGDYLSDYGALRRFALDMKNLAAANSTWMEIAFSPTDARRIIGENKLAIVLATEVDDLGDHCAGDFTTTTADDPNDHAKTSSTGGSPVWNEQRDLANAGSCTTAAQWTTRVDNLFNAGYRVIMPVHLADNDLGGTAIYNDLFNTNSQFMTGFWIDATAAGTSDGITYTFPQNIGMPGFWSGQEAGWTYNGMTLCTGGNCPPAYTPAPFSIEVGGYPFRADNLPFLPPAMSITSATNLTAPGFINSRSLTSNGLAVIAAAKARGMIIDVAHMDQAGRQRMLGLEGNETSSPLNPSCDMSTSVCQETSYPVVSTHAGYRALQAAREVTGGGPNEAGLSGDMIDRIIAIGGTIGVGTSAADEVDADTAAPDSRGGIFAEHVANTCGGSTRTFAQSYVFALRHTGGKGITLGTDMNGSEDRLNPRFGTQACYARGNVPWSYQLAWDDSVELVDDTADVPFNYRPSILQSAGGTAGQQRQTEQASSVGLPYRHYNGTPPRGGRFLGLQEPSTYAATVIAQTWDAIPPALFTPTSMNGLSSLPAMTAATTGNRTFDYNYDGLAHYGMLPDMLQDSRVVGMTPEQLAPLFQGAEALVETWERGCGLAGGCP